MLHINETASDVMVGLDSIRLALVLVYIYLQKSADAQSSSSQITNFGSTTVLPAVNGGLNMTNGLSVIPGSDGDVTLSSNLYYNYPLYWRLPDSFLGDKVIE